MKRLTVVVLLIGAGLACWALDRERAHQERYSGSSQQPRLDVLLEAVGQPHIALGSERYSAGTGFVVVHDGRHFIGTAFHQFLKRNEVLIRKQRRLEEVHKVELVGHSGTLIAVAEHALSMPHLALARDTDASGDVVLFHVRPDCTPKAGLRLASSAPLEGAPVWVLGVDRPAPARVVLSSDRRLVVEYENGAPGGRISGAPVVDEHGEVVGSCALAGRGACIAAPLESLLDAIGS